MSRIRKPIDPEHARQGAGRSGRAEEVGGPSERSAQGSPARTATKAEQGAVSYRGGDGAGRRGSGGAQC